MEIEIIKNHFISLGLRDVLPLIKKHLYQGYHYDGLYIRSNLISIKDFDLNKKIFKIVICYFGNNIYDNHKADLTESLIRYVKNNKFTNRRYRKLINISERFPYYVILDLTWKKEIDYSKCVKKYPGWNDSVTVYEDNYSGYPKWKFIVYHNDQICYHLDPKKNFMIQKSVDFQIDRSKCYNNLHFKVEFDNRFNSYIF